PLAIRPCAAQFYSSAGLSKSVQFRVFQVEGETGGYMGTSKRRQHSFTLVAAAIAVAAIDMGLTRSVRATTRSWHGYDDNYWSADYMWDPNGVPEEGDTVNIIDTEEIYNDKGDVILNVDSAKLASLTVDEDIAGFSELLFLRA